jgi:hypothetical protein
MAAGCVGLALVASSCVGYHEWPAQQGQRRLGDPNEGAMTEVMIAALKAAVERYAPADDPEAPVSLNLPVGLKPEVNRWVVDRVGPPALALDEETVDLPVYHIARVRIRGTQADVDVVRPVMAAGRGPAGAMGTQGVTFTLDGGVRAWRVVRTREWEDGVIQPPALNVLRDGAAATAGAGGG